MRKQNMKKVSLSSHFPLYFCYDEDGKLLTKNSI